MAISVFAELDGVTIGATEVSIITGTTTPATETTDGVYQLWVDDQTLMAKADEFAIRIFEKVELTGGTKRLVFKATLKGVQSEIWVSPMLILMHGWDMTLQKIAGTDRAFDANIRQIA